jgi:hypothetical protein
MGGSEASEDRANDSPVEHIGTPKCDAGETGVVALLLFDGR